MEKNDADKFMVLEVNGTRHTYYKDDIVSVDVKLGTKLTNAVNSCGDYADRLEKCESFQCQYSNPIFGSTMTKQIIGIENDKCHTVEEMPNKGMVDCKYPMTKIKAIAQYLRNLSVAQSSHIKISVSFGDKLKTKEEIDGKEVKDPLQESMSNGDCIMTIKGKRIEQGRAINNP